MRKLLGDLRVGLRYYPRLHGALRLGKAALARVHPSEMHRRDRRRAERIRALEREVQQIEAGRNTEQSAPILFFDASSHLANLSFNAATGLVAAWALRLAGRPVNYLFCEGGVGQCVQGTSRTHPGAPPPCTTCIACNRTWYPEYHSVRLRREDGFGDEVAAKLEAMTVNELSAYRHGDLELGKLCVPSARWILRRADLGADPAGQPLLAWYVASAVGLARHLDELLARKRPRALVAFNGTFFPEAIARVVALAHDIPVVTYEAGYRTLSAFFAHGVATEYPIHMPESFQMGPTEDSELDRYLADRMQGDFTMAGVRFWPEIKGVGPELRAKAEAHRQTVTVFTNVVFDTSQTYVHTVFKDMFDWLDETLNQVAEHPETLFIVRAHPDELRPGKESAETVEQFLQRRGPRDSPNLVFIPPTEYVSSYELIELSRFCVVYNSTVGLEAALLGRPVVTGGLTRYAQAEVTHSPPDREAYRRLLRQFLRDEPPPAPAERLQRARRYMYYSIFRVGLDLSAFLEPMGPQEYTVKNFRAEDLHPDHCPEMRIIVEGIIHGRPFCYA